MTFWYSLTKISHLINKSVIYQSILRVPLNYSRGKRETQPKSASINVGENSLAVAGAVYKDGDTIVNTHAIYPRHVFLHRDTLGYF